MRVVRKYAFVAYLSARSNLVYLAEVLSRVVFLGIILYVFARLWQAVFKHSTSGRLGDLGFEQMLWYLTVTEAITLSAPRVSANVDLDVRSGALLSYLQRPLSYPLYSLCSNFGERSVRFLVNFLVGSIICLALVGPPKLSLAALVFFAVSVPLAFTVDFLACFLIGLGAFWFEDTSGIFLVYSRISMILGGMLFPITVFPKNVATVLEYLPFAAITYGPAKLLVAPSDSEFIAIVLKQLLGAATFAILVWLTYRQASRRIFVNGG